jgi:hypothetical protein
VLSSRAVLRSLALALLVLTSACPPPSSGQRGAIIGASEPLRGLVDQALREVSQSSGVTLSAAYGVPADLMARLPLDILIVETKPELAPLAERVGPATPVTLRRLVTFSRAGAAVSKLAAAASAPEVQHVALVDSRVPGAGAAAEALMGPLGVRRAIASKLLYVGGPEGVRAAVLERRAELGIAYADEIAGTAGLAVVEELADPFGGQIVPIGTTPYVQLVRPLGVALAQAAARAPTRGASAPAPP